MSQAVRISLGLFAPSGTDTDAATRQVAAIEIAVQAALRESGRALIADLQTDCFVSTHGQMTVFLSGHLPSFYLTQLAQEIVRHVPGVQQVRNHIEVDVHYLSATRIR